MNEASVPIDLRILLLGLLVTIPCICVWIAIANRLHRKEPIVPYQPRQPVPWGGLHIAVVLVAYLVLEMLFVGLGVQLFGPNAATPKAIEEVADAASTTDKQDPDLLRLHPVAVVLIKSPGVVTVVTMFMVVVVVAPIAEEFFFRLLLQGWLEKVESRWRRRSLLLRKLWRGFVPVLLVSLFFAQRHARAAEPIENIGVILIALAFSGLARLATVGFAVLFLRETAGATAEDLGFGYAWTELRSVAKRICLDILLGTCAFLAVAIPIYSLQNALSTALPNIVVDPYPLFLFALALGFLYYRTHRLLPSIVLHMALNGVSLVGMLIQVYAGPK